MQIARQWFTSDPYSIDENHDFDKDIFPEVRDYFEAWQEIANHNSHQRRWKNRQSVRRWVSDRGEVNRISNRQVRQNHFSKCIEESSNS